LKKTKPASQELLELLYSPADPLPLSVFRIVFGVVLLVRFVTLCLQFDPLFTPNSFVSMEVSRQYVESPSRDLVPYLRWELFGLSPSTTWAAVIFAIYGASIGAFLLGWRTRFSTFLVFVCTVSIHRREPFIWTGGDYLAQLMTFWLLFLPAGAALSLDALQRRRGGLAQPVVRSWNLGVLQAQLAIVYLSTFLLKMGTTAWKQGAALEQVWRLPFHARPWSPYLASIPGLPEVGTWATLAFELTFPFLVWSRRVRPWLLGIGILFHAGIELTIRAGPFSYVMLACYVPFLSGEMLRSWGRWLGPLRTRLGNISWQREMLWQGKWVVYYNGDCGFCRRWVGRARRVAWRRVEWRDFQLHGSEVLHLNPRFDRAAYLVIGGRIALPGFRAFRTLLFAMPLLWPLLPLVYLPGSVRIGDALYRMISVRYGPASSAPACRANPS